MTGRGTTEPLRRWLGGWPDPPWLMSGQTVTAWFHPPEELSSMLLGTEFRARSHHPQPCRLRFYDVDFESAAADSWQREPRSGHFHEAVVAIPGRCGDIDGEISAFMWTDSDAYSRWGREIFGWPLLAGQVEMAGSVWEGSGSQGTATLRCESGTATITVRGLGSSPAADTAAQPSIWLTPRRVVRFDPGFTDAIQMTAVTPELRRRGTTVNVDADMELSFTGDHPLAGLEFEPAGAQLHRGFQIVVGSSVRTVASWQK